MSMVDEDPILYSMLLIRRVEEEIIARYGKQQMRLPVHLSIGQEAIAVGACHNLRREDQVFSTHRCHAHYLAKGGSLERMALELHGKVGGCLDGRGGSMHLMDPSVGMTASVPIVASAIPMAVGAALVNKLDGNDNVVICFFGDAAVEEGVFHESMNFASLMGLPIIFVCENNRYSVDTPIEKRQPERKLARLAYAHGMAHKHLDGWNILGLCRQFNKIISKVRRRKLPWFVTIDAERSYVHCGTDKEFELDIDPLEFIFELNDDYHIEKIDRAVKKEIKAAFDAAEAAPLPTPEMAKEYVYA